MQCEGNPARASEHESDTESDDDSRADDNSPKPEAHLVKIYKEAQYKGRLTKAELKVAKERFRKDKWNKKLADHIHELQYEGGQCRER